MPRNANSDSLDELAEINGIKPKTLLRDAETREAKSDSSDKSYTMKRTMDHYYCNCVSWRLAGGAPNARTCKHLKALLGDAYEEARLERTDPGSAAKFKLGKGKGKAKAPVKPKPAPKSRKTKAADGENEEDDDDDEDDAQASTRGKSTSKAKAKAAPKSRKRKADEGDEEEEEEEEEEEDDAPAPKRAKSTRKAAPKKTNNSALFKPLLAHKWDLDTGLDPTGWHMSEKLDGVRAIWHGSIRQFLSREGNQFFAPDWFTKRLPGGDVILDGELFTERGGFQKCVSIVRAMNAPDKWKFSVSYQVFDVPSMGDKPFEDRLEWLNKNLTGRKGIRWVHVLPHKECESREDLFEYLDEITNQKGEGVMLRQPGSTYVNGRSKTLLKVKKFLDADAIVRAHEQGTGKNVNCMGALRCEMLDDNKKPIGKMFKIGTGFTDKQRRNPPKIGSTVIFKYQELSNSGTPRFPSFGGVRGD